eukprot:14845505-Heterocapsa_arctica.AAC.1
MTPPAAARASTTDHVESTHTQAFDNDLELYTTNQIIATVNDIDLVIPNDIPLLRPKPCQQYVRSCH